ncbi:MAG: hypothetical protein HQ591_04475 [candidate division Zixibacteria bacterium]|nr:hypothetical protein [Candidatus Tariuqbacter arcticus]
MDLLTTFPRLQEYETVKKALGALSVTYKIITPGNLYRRVGVPAIVMSEETRMALYSNESDDLFFSGWVEYRAPQHEIDDVEPKDFKADIFGEATIMVLAPCIADRSKIRLVAHISGSLSDVFPYLNSEMKRAFYNANAPYLTFKDDYRSISLFPHRIAIAKADEIVDAWRVLEMIRRLVNEVWMRRDEIEPSYKTRKKPPALAIYKHLPQTNCGECGQNTCLAFALQLFAGSANITQCLPVFEGKFSHLQYELLEMCASL